MHVSLLQFEQSALSGRHGQTCDPVTPLLLTPGHGQMDRWTDSRAQRGRGGGNTEGYIFISYILYVLHLKYNGLEDIHLVADLPFQNESKSQFYTVTFNY